MPAHQKTCCRPSQSRRENEGTAAGKTRRLVTFRGNRERILPNEIIRKANVSKRVGRRQLRCLHDRVLQGTTRKPPEHQQPRSQMGGRLSRIVLYSLDRPIVGSTKHIRKACRRNCNAGIGQKLGRPTCASAVARSTRAAQNLTPEFYRKDPPDRQEICGASA